MKLNVDFKNAQEAIELFRKQINDMNGKMVEMGEYEERIDLILENLKKLGKSTEALDNIINTPGLSPGTINSAKFVQAWYQTRRNPTKVLTDAATAHGLTMPNPLSVGNAIRSAASGNLHFQSKRQRDYLIKYFETTNQKRKNQLLKGLVQFDTKEDPFLNNSVVYGKTDTDKPIATGKIPSKYRAYFNSRTGQSFESLPFSNKPGIISPDSGLYDTHYLEKMNEDLTTLRDASKEAFSGLTSDIRTTNTRAWQPFSNSITDASNKFSNELTPASDYAFTTATTGLSGLNTGFGTVNTAATSLFNLTGTGFGNSLLATQNYQTSGLAPLALGFGTTLPTQLGLFQTSHDTTFNQAEGKTSAAYTKMGLAAHDFFDDVGFQASHVLGGLVTGEIDSLDDAWETLVNGMGASFDNMLAELTQSLIGWATGSLADLAGAGFQDILAGLFNVGKGGNLSGTFDSILGSILGSGGGNGSSGVLGSIFSGGGGSGVGGQLLKFGSDQVLSQAADYAVGAISNSLTEYAMSSAAEQVGAQLGQQVSMGQWAAIDQAGTAPISSLLNGNQFMSSIGGSTGLMAAGAGLLAFDALVRFMPGGDPEGVVGGLKKTIGAAFGLTELDSLDPKRAALKYGLNQDYLGRVEDASGASFLSTDAAESGYKMDVYAGVMGLTPEEMDLVNLGLTGINEQMEALQLNMEEATRLGDDEWAASLEQQQEGLLAQTEQLMAINEQYGIGVEGLGQQNAAMLELSTASEQMAISLNNLGLAYENSHDHKMDEAAATADLVGYYQEMAAQVEELSGGAVVLGEDAEELVGQFLAGQVTSEQFAETMQEKLLAAMKKAQEEGKLLADQMNEIAKAIESIPTEWSSTVVTNYVTEGEKPDGYHTGGLVLHSGGLASSPLARIYGGMTRYHSGAYVSQLARDEVPAVLQRGEFVIRRDSVNAATLPSLKAINASGRASEGYGGVININAPLVQVEGNLIGDEDSKEDLVREIESRLISLANSRFRP